MKNRRKSKSKSKKQKKINKKSYSPTGAIIGITSGYVSIILLLLYFMKKDKDKTKKNARERSDTTISNDDAPSPGYKNSIASLNARPASLNIDYEEDDTIYEDSIEYSNKEIIDQFNKQKQIEQIKNIKEYLNNIEQDDVKSLIQYIVMNNLTLSSPTKIQIISENESYYCIILEDYSIQTFINNSKKVDSQSDYTLQITCDIDTALNLILNIYNSENKSGSFTVNYVRIIPFSYYIPDCFKLYKKGAEISIWNCAVNKNC